MLDSGLDQASGSLGPEGNKSGKKKEEIGSQGSVWTSFFLPGKFLFYPDWCLSSNEKVECLQEFASLGGGGLVRSLPASPRQKG